jgi:spermidine/putrescine ABC transporter ATP-binding subunit
VAIRRLWKRYGDQIAVGGIDLTVEPGAFVALLGPSGCGKTTILRCIAGLAMPDEGDIEIDDRSILDVPAYRRDLGMVFQSYALFPHMTVADNVAFGLRMRRAHRGEIAGRVKRALDLVKMGGLEQRYPRQLSGGQQQRVALARALVTEPTVLLLDEPLGALDAKLREAMQVELRQLQQRLGLTTIFVTHDQGEALTMADRVAVMSVGRVEQFAPAKEIYDRPRTPFVADFIGQMNKVNGHVEATQDGYCQVAADLTGKALTARLDVPCAVGQGVVAMIRPERLRLGATDADGIDARVTDAVFSGEKIAYYLDSPLGPLIAVAANAGGDAAHAPGARLRVSWRHEDVLIFPHEQK